jgi:hypothetical protein
MPSPYLSGSVAPATSFAPPLFTSICALSSIAPQFAALLRTSTKMILDKGLA